jgi:GrpB-like predicted nucleotidyltransferase (UPF0157 family)
MRIYTFDARSGRPVRELGSDFRLSPLTGLDDGVRVVVFHLDPGGRVGRHAAAVRQLFCVSAGSGWVSGADGEPYRIGAGYAALWEQGEQHETWTDDDSLSAFVLEGDFSVPARQVKGRPVEVVDHDPAWRSWFEQVRDRVAPVFEGMLVAIEHVGSTSVPGLAAKPVVDIDVVVPAEASVASAIDRLESIGYRHRGDFGVPGRQVFLPPAGLPRHELYVVVEGSEAHRNHVLLRDFLREHPGDARRYGEVKRRAAAGAGDDIEVYGRAKEDVVAALLALAGTWSPVGKGP